MGLDRDKLLDQLYHVLNKYNNTVYSTISMTANDARKLSNELVVKWELWNNANRTRKCPELSKLDEVRVMVKRNPGKTKGYFSEWSKEIFKAVAINRHGYIISDGKRRVYIRY